MVRILSRGLLPLVMFAAMAMLVAGCAKKDGGGDQAAATKEKEKEKPAEDDSATWWCPEHGVPEHVCPLCDKKLVDEFKKKGDWCEEHARPESQCFLCNPKRAEKFAADYRARYGKEPPPIDPENIKGGKK